MIFRADIGTGAFCLPDCARAAKAGAGGRDVERARDALAAGLKPCRECTPLRTGIADPPYRFQVCSPFLYIVLSLVFLSALILPNLRFTSLRVFSSVGAGLLVLSIVLPSH